MRILFTHPGQFMSLFSLILRRPSFQKIYSFSTFSSRSPNLTGASFKYSLISSSSIRSLVSKSPQVPSFVFQFFSVNCAFATFIFSSYDGLFKIPLRLASDQFICSLIILPVVRSTFLFLYYRIISFVLSNPPGDSANNSSSWRYIPLQSLQKK